MQKARIAAAAFFTLALGAFALHAGCSSDDEPECTRDSNCSSATTGCTRGVCKDGKCEAQPVADGTRVADQSPVQGKFCVKLECKAGKATEVNDTTKTPPEVPCQKQVCENMASKPELVGDGVPCMSSMGSCQAGMCVLNPESGPIGMPDTSGSEAGDDAVSDSESPETEPDATAD